MKKSLIIIITVIFLSPLYAEEYNYPDMSFFAGTYDLIGKNSSGTYSGKSIIEVTETGFKMTRIINNQNNIIYGTFNKNLPEGFSSLDFKYKEDNMNYIISYHWYIDYNNYPLLSGSVSIENKRSREYGIEYLRISTSSSSP